MQGLYGFAVKLLEVNMRDKTKLFTALAIGAMLVYDVYAYMQGGQDATISSVVITDWSKNYPAFTFMVGFLMGHLFWPLKKEK